MKFKIPQLLVLLMFSFGLQAQQISYDIALEPVEIPGFGGVQSFAYALHNDDILIIGGRLDGLHQRQPFAAFDEGGNNTNIIVINPTSRKVWKSGIAHLPAMLKEQLSSTNMQFYQQDNRLMLTGGYSYSPTSGDHTTFPYLTIVDVPNLIKQVKADRITLKSFHQKKDEAFAVCGGQLNKIGNTFYLVGGHRFEGRYNPIGPDHGPGFEQEYTHEIRKFDLHFTDTAVSVKHHAPVHDEMHLRRRDYNLLPQIRNGKEELMAFSGVFQKNNDVPWLYPISIQENAYIAIEEFRQYFNHYHCGKLAIHHPSKDEMHNIFLGGIAQFYQREGILVQDNDVPFVKTITDVVRFSDGKMVEQPLSVEMPDYLGAGSELIVHKSLAQFPNGVIKGDLLDDSFTEIGYLLGGIRSSAKNIFFQNTGVESEASATLFKVLLRKVEHSLWVDQDWQDHQILIYTNPERNFTNIGFFLENVEPIEIKIHDVDGNLVDQTTIIKDRLKSGRNILTVDNLKTQYGMYLYTLDIGGKVHKRWVHWSE